MNVLSLFDGCGMAFEALKKAGIKVDNYFASEIDDYAIKIANKNHDIINLGDINNWRKWDLPEIDLVIGGSPCQGFSFAGKQLNFNDPRSKLIFELFDIIENYNPKYKFLENVKMSKRSTEVISKFMGVEPIMINSELLSAQLRSRNYWTNIENASMPKDKKINLSQIIKSGYVDRDKSFCIDANYFKGGNLNSYFDKSRRQLVFNSYEDYLECLKNKNHKGYRKLSVEECELLQTLPPGYTEGVSNTQRYKMIGNGFTVDVIAHILGGLK